MSSSDQRYQRSYYLAHKEEKRVKRQARRAQVRAYDNDYQKTRYHLDPTFRLSKLVRTRVGNALKRQKAYKPGSTVRALGCTISELRKHLEALFQPGMTWENHGEWHIDHIKPLAGFDLSDPAQFSTACHYTNLQPLWATENIKKSDSEVI